MGFRIRRSARLFRSAGIDSNVWTSVGAPGTGISFRPSSNGSGPFILGTALFAIISVLVLLLA